jgi:hypothetical protein
MHFPGKFYNFFNSLQKMTQIFLEMLDLDLDPFKRIRIPNPAYSDSGVNFLQCGFSTKDLIKNIDSKYRTSELLIRYTYV